MYTSAQRPFVSVSEIYRWCARLAGALVIGCWLSLFIRETMRFGIGLSDLGAAGQAAALTIVFAGYIVGWWKEFLGGVLVFAGMIAFFAVITIGTHRPPDPTTIWFAAPGILYLLAAGPNDKPADYSI